MQQVTKLISYLLDNKIISKHKLNAIEKYADTNGVSIEDALSANTKITQEKIFELKAQLSNIPRVSLKDYKPNDEFIELLSPSFIRTKKIIPFEKEGNLLSIAMENVEDLETQEIVKRLTGLELKIFYASPADINSFIEKSNFVKEEKNIERTGKQTASVKSMASDDRLVSMVEEIIDDAVKHKASDIHFEPLEDGLLVRVRINGDLQDVKKLEKEFKESIVARIKVLANLKLDEHRLPQDGRFKKRVNNLNFAFRISVMPVFDGEKIALRILQEEGRSYSLGVESYGQEGIDALMRSIRKPHGMILVTGPTGSGKTTVLYTLLQMINQREINIVTLEDPIEYHVMGISQTQVRPEIGLTFASGLRTILRQDPDVVMVGEIRDRETAELAINAALTGHLVLSTLHTNTASGALPRLLDLGVERFLISSTVNIVAGLRLVKTLGEANKKQYSLNHQEIESLRKDFGLDIDGIVKVLKSEGILQNNQDLTNIPFYKPQPTSDYPMGYVSRMAIGELIEMNEELRSLVYRGANANEIETLARHNGMKTLRERGFIAAAKGLTSLEEVLKVTED